MYKNISDFLVFYVLFTQEQMRLWSAIGFGVRPAYVESWLAHASPPQSHYITFFYYGKLRTYMHLTEMNSIIYMRKWKLTNKPKFLANSYKLPN